MNPYEKSQKRATDIIAAYGAEQSAWPEAERAATLDALQSSDEVRQILFEEVSLDSLLQQSARVATLDATQVAQKIVRGLPQMATVSLRKASDGALPLIAWMAMVMVR